MKVAVIGVGYLGEHHARVFSEIEDVELSGVVDIREDRAIEIASRFSTKAYTDYRDVLDKVDALSIVTPTTSHYEIGLEVLKTGKDLFIEKPITRTVKEADELIEEAEKRGCILQVGHIERYNPALVALLNLIQSPTFIEAERLSPFLGRGADVDVTVDLMIHDIDIILRIVDSEIRDIRAKGLSLITGMIDTASVWIEFKNGVMANLRANRVSSDKVRVLRVFEKTSTGQRIAEVDFKDSRLRVINGEAEKNCRPEYKEPLKEELKDFVRSVITRNPLGISGLQARRALKVALDINSIIRKGWN